jgi:hypothetical protein
MSILVIDQLISAFISYLPLSIFWITDNYADLTIAGVFLTFYSIGLAILRATYFNLLVKGQAFKTNLGLIIFAATMAISILISLMVYLQFTFPQLVFQQRLVAWSIAVGVIQEIFREREIAANRKTKALIGDGIWLVASAGILMYHSLQQNIDLILVFRSWGIGGLISIGYFLASQNRGSLALHRDYSSITHRGIFYLALIPFVGFSHTLIYTFLYSSEQLIEYLFITKAILFCTIPLNFVINLQQFALLQELQSGNSEGVHAYFRRQRYFVLIGVLSGFVLFLLQFDSSSGSIDYFVGFATALTIGLIGVNTNPEFLNLVVQGKFRYIFYVRIIWLFISFISFEISILFSSQVSLLLALIVPDLLLHMFLKNRNKLRLL